MDPYGGYPPPHHPLSYPPYVATRLPHPLHPAPATHLPPHMRPPSAVANFPGASITTPYPRPGVPGFPVAYPNSTSLHATTLPPVPIAQLQQTTAVASPSTGNPIENKATVYVGKIPPTVEDDFIKRLLEKCGPVTNWRRMADPLTGGLSSFGFCDYTNPDGAIRALLLLNNAVIDGQPLLLKVNEKTQKQLDDYKKCQVEEVEEHQENTNQIDDEIKTDITQMIAERKKQRSNGEDDQDADSQISRELKMARERQAQKDDKRDEERDRERELRKERERERMRIREQRDREREREARRRDREDREFKERERDWELKEREKDRERERRDKIDVDHIEDMDERKRRKRARERKQEKEEDDYDREKEAEEIRQQLVLQQKQEQAQRKLQFNDDQKKEFPPPGSLLAGAPQHLFGSVSNELKTQHGIGFGLAAAAASLVKRRKMANTAIGPVVEEEEEPELVPRKKRALVTLENEAASHDAFDSASSLSSSTSSAPNEPKLSAAEVKKIIDSIPVDKDALFSYEIDWDIVDQSGIIDNKMKSWVRSKVIEYLGKGVDVDEIAKELVDFIVSTLKRHGTANDLLSEVSTVFDDDGLFLAKMWRKLIFEIQSAQYLRINNAGSETTTSESSST